MGKETLAEYADTIIRNLQVLLRSALIIRDVYRQWKRGPEAIVPLLLLGWEGDLEGAWEIVGALDRRFALRPFSPDEAADIRLLECALDAVSAQILEEACPRIRALFPSFLLRYGLLEGYWCIYAVLPRGTWDFAGKPVQRTLLS